MKEYIEKDREEEGGQGLENQDQELILEKSEEFLAKDMKEETNNALEEMREELGEPEESVKETQIGQDQENKSLKEKIIKGIKGHKKLCTNIGISLAILIAFYFSMAFYFKDHFYFGSQIHSISISGKNIEDAKDAMKKGLDNYTLSLKGRMGLEEEIKGRDIQLQYVSLEELKELKREQDPFKWISSIFHKESLKRTIKLSYDKNLLKETVDNLSYFDKENISKPKNPRFHYAGNKYIIINERPGTQVDKKLLLNEIAKSILNTERELDLEVENCYVKANYHYQAPQVLKASNILNKYVASKITYNFGDSLKVLDGFTIHRWLEIDDNFRVTINEEKLKEYIDDLAESYNTVGRIREFSTSHGKTIKIGGGDYGWEIDRAKEKERLISDIKTGKTIRREAEYGQRGLSWAKNDIGDTYVEIDLSGQHMWFYKDGQLLTRGNIVTGNVQKNHTTPPGVFSLKYKARNVVLRGPGYASPVSFWMPFNGGIGIHDANWRSTFGGNIYKTNGSHGCINSPYPVAKIIFDNIKAETAVICY